MTKDEIIDELINKHEVWKCGYTRFQLEMLSKTELKNWLKIEEAEIDDFE